MARPSRFFPLLATAALLALAACSHYRLGPPTAPRFASVYVAPVANTTSAPQAVALVTTQLRSTLARDGRVELADSAAAADAQVEVRLTGFHREVAAVRHDDTARARKYVVTLTAEVSVIDRAGQRPIDRRQIPVSRDVFLDSGQQPTEYQTLPLLAAALATEIAHVVLDTW